MSFFIVYVVPGAAEPVDGEIVASGLGWDSWCSYAEENEEDLPHALHLSQEGWIEPAEALDALAGELESARDDMPPDVAGVSGRLVQALGERPEGTVGIIVSDGVEGE